MRTAARRMAIALVGGATLGYLAYGLWQAQQREERHRWRAAIQHECSRVVAIMQGIRESAIPAEQDTSAESTWAGVYQTDGRDRIVIAISASDSAAIELSYSCFPQARVVFEGRIVERDRQRIRIEWMDGPVMGRLDQLRGNLYFVKWGDRRMLIEGERLADLRKAVAEFKRTGKAPWTPRCFVREGDEDKPVYGEPDWPPGFDGDGG